jgi:hypothetical protein
VSQFIGGVEQRLGNKVHVQIYTGCGLGSSREACFPDFVRFVESLKVPGEDFLLGAGIEKPRQAKHNKTKRKNKNNFNFLKICNIRSPGSITTNKV